MNLTEFRSLCIERWLGRDHGGTAEVWLAQQAAYDLWQARQTFKATKALTGVKYNPTKRHLSIVADASLKRLKDS